jgi:hypothetical protein
LPLKAYPCALPSFDPHSELKAILDNRTEVQREAQTVVAATGLPVATELVGAMQDSLDSDGYWLSWIDSTFRRWRNQGCHGSPPTTGDGNWDAFLRLSGQATADKQDFVTNYDPQAAQYGLRHDWQATDL